MSTLIVVSTWLNHKAEFETHKFMMNIPDDPTDKWLVEVKYKDFSKGKNFFIHIGHSKKYGCKKSEIIGGEDWRIMEFYTGPIECVNIHQKNSTDIYRLIMQIESSLASIEKRKLREFKGFSILEIN